MERLEWQVENRIIWDKSRGQACCKCILATLGTQDTIWRVQTKAESEAFFFKWKIRILESFEV